MLTLSVCGSTPAPLLRLSHHERVFVRNRLLRGSSAAHKNQPIALLSAAGFPTQRLLLASRYGLILCHVVNMMPLGSRAVQRLRSTRSAHPLILPVATMRLRQGGSSAGQCMRDHIHQMLEVAAASSPRSNICSSATSKGVVSAKRTAPTFACDVDDAVWVEAPALEAGRLKRCK